MITDCVLPYTRLFCRTEAYTAGAQLLQALQSVVASPPQDLNYDVRFDAVTPADGTRGGQRGRGVTGPSGTRAYSGQGPRQQGPR